MNVCLYVTSYVICYLDYSIRVSTQGYNITLHMESLSFMHCNLAEYTCTHAFGTWRRSWDRVEMQYLEVSLQWHANWTGEVPLMSLQVHTGSLWKTTLPGLANSVRHWCSLAWTYRLVDCTDGDRWFIDGHPCWVLHDHSTGSQVWAQHKQTNLMCSAEWTTGDVNLSGLSSHCTYMQVQSTYLAPI